MTEWLPLAALSEPVDPKGLVPKTEDLDAPSVFCRVNVSEVLDIRVVDHAFMAKFDLELRMAASLYDKLNEADDVRYDRLFAFVNLAEVIHVPDRRVVRTDGEVRVKLVLRARFSTYFQLATFPHDSHRLEIKLTSNIPCALGPAEDAGSPQVTLNMLPDNTKPNVMANTSY